MSTVFSLAQTHPMLATLLGIILALAVVGLWYVIFHHLQAIVTTLICAAGTACGAVVFWRGVGSDLMDLILIGAFLMVVFPVFFYQTVQGKKKSFQITVGDGHTIIGSGPRSQTPNKHPG